MLYQKLLMGEGACHVDLGSVAKFAEHRHPEAEFVWCLQGTLNITIDKTVYPVRAGELALVAPMAAHAYDNERDPNRVTLVIEAGPSLLGGCFEAFTHAVFSPPVKMLDDSTEDRRRLRMLLAETAELRRTGDASQELLLLGSVYKICGYILREFADASESDGDLRAVANIDKALALIRDRFAEPITVDMAAAITGYGKSNFCRIFKHIVGETFHSALNRRRVENACCYLGETAMPVSDIAGLVGFADAKSFCRVFKSITGMSPGQYRTAQRHR